MSQDILNGPPSLRALTTFPTKHGKVNIPQEIGVRYQAFGAQLLDDPTGTKVDNLEHKHGRDSLRINTEVFQEWLRGQGRRPVSWRTLTEILQDIELGRLAEDIEACSADVMDTEDIPVGESCSANVRDTEPSLSLRNTRQQTTLNSWQNISITILVATFSLLAIVYWPQNLKPLNGYMNVLKGTYQTQPITDPDHWLHIVMPFIDLTLTEGGISLVQSKSYMSLHGLGMKRNLTLDEVVHSIKEGSRILIEGRPGVGKTTLLRHISKQWAERKYLQNFQLVVLVFLGHTPSSRVTNLETMLEYHSHGYPDTASVARELGLTGGKGICFLLDAFDEYLPQEGDFIYQLIKGKTLPDAAMIVTSRPNASYHLRQYFKRKFEVVGFLEHQIQQYIRALPFNNAAIISEYLHHHTNVKRISYLPLHLAMVTYLALYSERVSLLDLDTNTKIYHMFVNLTFRHRYKDVENLDEIHNQAFSALSKIAFDATTRSDDGGASLRLHHLDPELWPRLESFSIVSINKQHEGDKIHYTFTFSHNTFQEFFSAYYLTTLPHEEQMEALELYQNSPPLMWRFFFGLLRARTSEATTKLFEKFAHIHISTAWLHEKGAIMMCAYELKQTAIAEVLVQVLNYSVAFECFYPSVCAASAYVISLNPHQFKKLKIRFGHIIEDHQEACFASMLAELPNNNEVVHVTFHELSLSDGTVLAMVKLLQYFPNLQRLELFDLYATPGISFTVAKELEGLKHVRHVAIRIGRGFGLTLDATMLTEVLTHLPHLEHLSLRRDVLGTLEHKTNLQLGLLQGFIGASGAVAVVEGLKNAVNLQHLDLSQNLIGANGAVAVAKGLKNKVNLQYLALEDNDIGDDGALAIAEGLKNAASLRTLKLRGNTIGDDGVAALAEGIKHLTSLQEVKLESNEIGNDGAAALAESIKHLTSLRVVELESNKIDNDGATALAEGIKHLTSLQALNLADNQIGVVALNLKNLTSLKTSINEIGAESLAKLAEGIKHLTSLKVLKLSWNIIGEGVATLAEGLKHLTSLQVLELNGIDIRDEGVAELAEGIKHLTSLKVLELNWNRLIRHEALAEGLKHLTSLQVLELTGNRMGDEGVTALAEGIKHLTSLQVLKLNRNKIGADGAAVLAECIKHLTSLQTLDLSINRIGDDGVTALAEGIKDLTSLQTLNLGQNGIGDDGVVPLARGLRSLTSLKELDLYWNEIGEMGAARLVEETKHVKRLYLWRNKISDEEIAKLDEARKTGLII